MTILLSNDYRFDRASTVPPQGPKQKPSITIGDFDDVTLGSSAVFEGQNLRKRRKNREHGLTQIY
jgi:hypothetical protein